MNQPEKRWSHTVRFQKINQNSQMVSAKCGKKAKLNHAQDVSRRSSSKEAENKEKKRVCVVNKFMAQKRMNCIKVVKNQLDHTFQFRIK